MRFARALLLWFIASAVAWCIVYAIFSSLTVTPA